MQELDLNKIAIIRGLIKSARGITSIQDVVFKIEFWCNNCLEKERIDYIFYIIINNNEELYSKETKNINDIINDIPEIIKKLDGLRNKNDS